MRLFFILVFFVLNIYAYDNTEIFDEDDNELQSSIVSLMPQDVNTKVLYLQFDKVPSRIIKGEIFPVTIRTLSTTNNFTELVYSFFNARGVEIINTTPYSTQREKYFYDTFYFKALSTGARLPDIEASLISTTNDEYKSAILNGIKLNVVALNPKRNFSNIIANSFVLSDYKTTSFDNMHNIVIFVAEATNCDIDKLKLNNVYKQGIESSTNSIKKSKITYFVVIDKKIENFKFTYFNLIENDFKTISIPIIVDDDSVTTQSDLKPRDQSKEKLKMFIAIAISIFLLILIVWRKKYIYSVLLIFPITYSAYVAIPSKEICIKVGSNIHLLPVHNGTIFETTDKIIYLRAEGEVKDFTKVKLLNNKIGWVKHEDLCSY
ncbi:MAG: hypothetical protein L3I99_07930 [Sulfurimonas sp.]|nr:hypothetical protein [Sulfurimonas sp.]